MRTPLEAIGTFDKGVLRLRSARPHCAQDDRFFMNWPPIVRLCPRLLPVRCEGQEDVASHGVVVSGVDVDHPPDHGCACAVERASVGGDAVNGRKIAGGIEVPDHDAVGGVVGAQMSVERAGEDDPGNCGGRRHLGGAATELSEASWIGRSCVPSLLAGFEFEREEADSRMRSAVVLIGERVISVSFVSSPSPLNAAQWATVAEAFLPESFTALVGIETVDEAGFLSEEQNVFSGRRATE